MIGLDFDTHLLLGVIKAVDDFSNGNQAAGLDKVNFVYVLNDI